MVVLHSMLLGSLFYLVTENVQRNLPFLILYTYNVVEFSGNCLVFTRSWEELASNHAYISTIFFGNIYTLVDFEVGILTQVGVRAL
jgi:hypothetical protein